MQTPDIPASAMTLRDYFAAQAMAAVCRDWILADPGKELEILDLAADCYHFADAMLSARADHPTTWPGLFTNTDFAKDLP